MVNYIGMEAMDLGFNAHVTIMLLPNSLDKDRFEFVRDTIKNEALWTGSTPVVPTGIDLFGEALNVPVLKVKEESLTPFRKFLSDRGIEENPNAYEFNPHITFPSFPLSRRITIPLVIILTNMYIKWNGERHYVFD